jgi:hypothetical protein
MKTPKSKQKTTLESAKPTMGEPQGKKPNNLRPKDLIQNLCGNSGAFLPPGFPNKRLAEKVILNMLGNHFVNLST